MGRRVAAWSARAEAARRRRAARRVHRHGRPGAQDRARPVDDLPAGGRGQVSVARPPRQAHLRVAPRGPRAVGRRPSRGIAVSHRSCACTRPAGWRSALRTERRLWHVADQLHTGSRRQILPTHQRHEPSSWQSRTARELLPRTRPARTEATSASIRKPAARTCATFLAPAGSGIVPRPGAALSRKRSHDAPPAVSAHHPPRGRQHD